MADVPNFDKATPVIFEKKVEHSSFYFSIPNAEIYYDIVEEQMCYVYEPDLKNIERTSTELLYFVEHLKANDFVGDVGQIQKLIIYLSN